MAQEKAENTNSSLELRFKRWTAVAVVCFLGLLAALPFRSTNQGAGQTVAPSHRERSLRFRAEAAAQLEPEVGQSTRSTADRVPRVKPPLQDASPAVIQEVSQGDAVASRPPKSHEQPSRSLQALPQEEDESRRACFAKQGETLMDIAERVLGDRRRWRDLVELNPVHRSAFDELAEGEQILLPEGR